MITMLEMLTRLPVIALLLASTHGSGLAMVPCKSPTDDDLQRWAFDKSDSSLKLATNSTAGFVTYGGDGVPLTGPTRTLQPCNTSSPGQRWTWDAAARAVRLSPSNTAVCFNVRTKPGGGASPGSVGGYFPFNPTGNPHNEVFHQDQRVGRSPD